MHHHHHLLIAALITIAACSTILIANSGKHQSTGYPAFQSQGNGPVVFTVGVQPTITSNPHKTNTVAK